MIFDSKCEITIDGSRFIGLVKTNFDADDLMSVLDFLSKEYKKCRHICYAYSCTIDGINKKKYSDDGEPKGTAGLPILTMIEMNNLDNALVLVVRYFGGKKLGASKLLRSYRKAANDAIKKVS